MKITVLTDKAGKVIGTLTHLIEREPGAMEGRLVAGPDQSAHVIDLPNEEVEGIKDADELHRNLESRLSGGASKSRSKSR